MTPRTLLRASLVLMIGTIGLTLATPLLARAAPQATTASGAAQSDLSDTVARLTSRVNELESRVDKTTGGALAFLFGAFCALWAQNTKRNPWVWFITGALFNVIAVLVLLVKNSEDHNTSSAPSKRPWILLAVLLGLIILTVLLLWVRAS